MNQVATLPQKSAGALEPMQDFSSQGLLMDFNKITAMQSLAEAMSTASIAVPAHFRNKPGDCLAVVMQAAQWGMNPFAVAQKTHVVNGALGYEAQLVNAVVQASGAIEGRFHYEFRGDGAGVECRVGAIMRGEKTITWGEWLSASSVTTKNSPLWKTNPKQQLGYLQVKNWARAHTPGAILGVYSTDELEEMPVRDMGAAEVVADSAPATNTRTAALKNQMGVGKAVKLQTVLDALDAAQTAEDLLKAAEQAKKLPDDDKSEAAKRYTARLHELKAAAKPANVDAATGEIDPDDDALKQVEQSNGLPYAEVAAKLNGASNQDDLDLAADLIQHVAEIVRRDDLARIYKARVEEFKGAK